METTSCYTSGETNILDLTDGLLCLRACLWVLRCVSVVEYLYLKLKKCATTSGKKLSNIIRFSEFKKCTNQW